MRAGIIAAACAALSAGAGAPPAGADTGEFVGSATCGACHEREYELWRDTPHARAYATLGDDARRAECRTCHATGDAPLGRAYFPGVGCESCHGAGAAYAPADIMKNVPLARALGLRELGTAEARAAVCDRCHAESKTRIRPFETEEAWERIAH